MSDYEVRTGSPFTGHSLEQLRSFLKKEELDYDERITYTVELVDEEGEIIACGSCEGNVLKCIAVSPEHQGQNLLAPVMSNLFQHLADQGIFHYFGFTKPKNKTVFTHMGLYPVAETDHVLLLENKRDGFKKYVESLHAETEERMAQGKENPAGEGIGAIVANCNPFTLGHRYLVEEASKKCKWVHVFVLSAEQGWITAQDRFNMVQAGTADLDNVILHVTSDYLISPVVFPTYFIKDKVNAFSINCMLDIQIFREHIAKELGITRRFVGTEPSSEVTKAYNELLKENLPAYGIEVTELERLQNDGLTISASSVRKFIQEKDFEAAAKMLPKTTYDYLAAKKGFN
ncbi:[citrate (pro-3S)-lyase] ligase [Treponema zioleckii]|uniref:[citrate (pro-3S)-lyase] ligase n=1 Tax=Treponema zioleckii TaxID=331680 RepID=UPI00168B3511|nr:[citrate (pro-3S)-lyase] ligase [Treponema zioleckii]